MSRASNNIYDSMERLIDGYDYKNQAWVENGRYVRCGHREVNCDCYGTQHEGEQTA